MAPEEDGPEMRWDDLREAMQFMWPEERLVLRLMREGKAASDVAAILELSSRQRAQKEMRRVIEVAKFFSRHQAAVLKLYGTELPITRRQQVIVRMYAVSRMTHEQIALELGNQSRWPVWERMRDAKKKLTRNHRDVARLLKESSARQWLRKRRTFMASEKWRKDLVDYLLANLGRIWYVWGGQDVNSGEADCSGLVLEVLKAFKRLPKDAPDMTAQGFSRKYSATTDPRPGDLAFYGSGWSNVTHVMFHVGEVDGNPSCVVGMSGGRRGMTKDQAMKLGAAMWLKRSPKYRRDFLGYRRVV